VFVAPDGNIQEVMCCDYGFRSGFGRLYQGGDGEIPKSAIALVRSCSPVNWHAHGDPQEVKSQPLACVHRRRCMS